MPSIDTLPVPPSPLTRQTSTLCDLAEDPSSSFALGASHKSYKHQFSNLYFVRLRKLRDAVERRARSRWEDVDGSPALVPRVLEVVKGQTCFIVGTVYMEMPLKPNVLEDVSRDRSIPAPPPREKFYSPDDAIMLEDESGRIQLVGDVVTRELDPSESHPEKVANLLVTGVIMAALGRETASGEFQVLDICFAGMAPMLLKTPEQEDGEEGMEVDLNSKEDEGDNWIAVVSGLELAPPSSSSESRSSQQELRLQMLTEYLSCEAGGPDDQLLASKISRLLIAGNSLASPETSQQQNSVDGEKRTKRFGQDAPTFSSAPTRALGAFLQDITEIMPVHLLPGASDPTGSLMPQQPFPRGMFPAAVKERPGFTCETNPAWLALDPTPASSSSVHRPRPRAILAHAGQPVDDMYKYTPGTSAAQTRLDLACATVRWRHMAPTAPDTLWCYPYFMGDPFIVRGTPDVLLVGCQPAFATRLVSERGEGEEEEGVQRCRVVLVPRFAETGTLVLVNLRDLEVRTVRFDTEIG